MIPDEKLRRFNKLGSSLLQYVFYGVLIIRVLTAVYILSGNMSDTQEISRFFFLDAFLSSIVKLVDALLDYVPDPKRPKKSSMHKLKTLFMFAVPKKRK